MNESTKGRHERRSQPLPSISGEKPTVPQACCKVQRVTEAYHLSGINDELRRQYESGDATLHELANYINDRITSVTLGSIENPIEAEPATVRAALNEAEDMPATKRDNIRATLAGRIDIDVLVDSFVSHETVRRHLNEHLDVSTSRGGFETIEELQEALDAYQEQYENGVRSALQRANKKGLIEGDQYRIFSTRIECQHCSETYRLQELLERRGCSCQLQD
jgi:hypothetical protein